MPLAQKGPSHFALVGSRARATVQVTPQVLLSCFLLYYKILFLYYKILLPQGFLTQLGLFFVA